jgi:hypothetical protein
VPLPVPTYPSPVLNDAANTCPLPLQPAVWSTSCVVFVCMCLLTVVFVDSIVFVNCGLTF